MSSKPHLDESNDNIVNTSNTVCEQTIVNELQTIKFKAYTETSEEVTEILKVEELEELNKILADLNTIQEINRMLVDHLGEQKENLKEMEESIVVTNEVLDNVNMQLVEVKENQVSYFYTKTGAVVLITAVVTWPLSAVVGVKAGLIAGAISLVSSLVTVSMVG
jgi:hypothetical protein